MAVKLSFDERKCLQKCYLKVENVVKVQRRWRAEFGTPPTRGTITRIRDKFEVDGTVQVVLKGRYGRERSSVRNNPDGLSLCSTSFFFFLGVYCGKGGPLNRYGIKEV